jgi:hypothetical protein
MVDIEEDLEEEGEEAAPPVPMYCRNSFHQGYLKMRGREGGFNAGGGLGR